MAEQKTRFDIEQAIMEKSVRDEAFRAQLVSDPKGTLARELQTLTGRAVKLPESVTVTVHEETPEHIHLVVPARMEASAELDAAELAQVNGGQQHTGNVCATLTLSGGHLHTGNACVTLTCV